MNAIQEKFLRLESELNSEIYERSGEIHTALLALISRRHHFVLGSPGTAKSMTVNRLTARMDLGDEGTFVYLMTPYTTPPEICGPPRLPDLKEGIYRVNTYKKLPRASVAFLDEIFRANSSILNTLLTMMNERRFDNGPDDDPWIPLVSIFSAANSIPTEPELMALWDRLDFRHSVDPLRETTSFMQMLAQDLDPNPEKFITLDDVLAAQDQAKAVVIPEDIYGALRNLRGTLADDGIDVTERRWKNSLSVIKAEAWLDGHEIADIDHLRPLAHMLWSDMNNIKQVRRHVWTLANPIDAEAADLLDIVIDEAVKLERALQERDTTDKDIQSIVTEAHKKLAKVNKKMKTLSEQAAQSSRRTTVLDELKVKLQDTAIRLIRDGLKMDPDEALSTKEG